MEAGGGPENSEPGGVNKFAILKHTIKEKFQRTPQKNTNFRVPTIRERAIAAAKQVGRNIREKPLRTTLGAFKAAAGVAVGPGDELAALGAQALHMAQENPQQQEYILPKNPGEMVPKVAVKKSAGAGGNKGLAAGEYQVTVDNKPIASVSVKK